MSADTINFLLNYFGSYGRYIVITVLASIAFFYLTNQFFSIKKISLEQRSKKLEDVKVFLTAVEGQNDLLIEEAFFLIYGFPVQFKEVTYITERENKKKPNHRLLVMFHNHN